MLTLFIDADDTLWENNIYFEAVVQHYCTLVEAHGVGSAEARARLLEIVTPTDLDPRLRHQELQPVAA